MVGPITDLARAWRRVLRRYLRPRGRRGATVIEFAAVLGVVLILMVGVMEFGSIYKDLMVLNQATREGARSAIVGATSDVVAARVRATATSLRPERISTQAHYSVDDGNTFGSVLGVDGGQNDAPRMALIRVRTAYPHRMLTGVVLPGVTEVTLRCDMIMQRQ